MHEQTLKQRSTANELFKDLLKNVWINVNNSNTKVKYVYYINWIVKFNIFNLTKSFNKKKTRTKQIAVVIFPYD